MIVQRQQHVIDDQKAALGVAGNPANLVGGQSQIQCVHHATGRRNAQITFQVGVMIPAQRGDPIAFGEAGSQQR